MNVTILNSTHEIGDSLLKAGKCIAKPVKIGKGCWIGANATIFLGIEICDGTIIAAGSVVTKDCEQNCIYAGVPAKNVKELQ